MTQNRTRPVPSGVPTLVGVAGFAAVAATTDATWMLIVSALLAAALIGADIWRLVAARRDAA